MDCPACRIPGSRTIKTWFAGASRWRRRMCVHCGLRFLTEEWAEDRCTRRIYHHTRMDAEDAEQESALAQLEGRDPQNAADAFKKREDRRRRREVAQDPAAVDRLVDGRFRAGG